MQCRKCKKDIADDSTFCSYCGVKQAVSKAVKKRGNGQGTIFKHGSGYAVEITLGYTNEGKRRARRKQGFKTKTEAVAYVEMLKRQEGKAERVTFGQLWNDYTMSPQFTKLSASRQKCYTTAWKKLCSSLDYRDVKDTTVSDLLKVFDEVFGSGSKYSAVDGKIILGSMYKMAIANDYVVKDCSQFLVLPENEGNKRDRMELTDDEIKSIWDDYNNSSDFGVSALLLIMLYTGMRTGEMIGLKSENIHLDEHYATGGIKTEKGKARKIVIPDIIIPIIQKRMGFKKISPYTERSFEYYFSKQKSDLGLRENITPYCCRHTFITRLTRSGASPAVIQELVGHVDYNTTLKSYTHMSVEDGLQAVNKL